MFTEMLLRSVKLTKLLVAFDVGRTLPNTDLSRNFVQLVVIDEGVDRWITGKEPGIEIGQGLFDLFVLRWAFALFCDCSFYALEEKRGINFVLLFVKA